MSSSNLKTYFWSQVRFLVLKDLTILLKRQFVSTMYASLLLPILLTAYLGVGGKLAGAGDKYSISEPRPLLPLWDALDKSAGASNRSIVVFLNKGAAADDIDRVIATVGAQVTGAGKRVFRVNDTQEVGRICTVSAQGATPCYGAVEFHSSPGQGTSNSWSYTLRTDSILGRTYDASKDDNDPEIYVLPLQHAIDTEIVRSEDPGSPKLQNVQEWPFSQQSEAERQAKARRDYQSTFISYMGVVVLLGYLGMPYHVSAYVAMEREQGLSQLVSTMMFTRSAQQAQRVRMVAYFSSFSMVYLTGWIAGAMILKFMLWREASVAIVLPYFLLAGFAVTSQGLIGGTAFKRSQLSGVGNALGFVLLGVLVQAVSDLGTPGAVILSLVFTPCNMVLFIKYLARYELEGKPANLLKAPSASDHSLPGLVLLLFLLAQIITCPFIAAYLERWLYDAAADSRTIWTGQSQAGRPREAVTIEGLTKTYRPGLFRRMFSFALTSRPPTVAVGNLNLSIPREHIFTLLGANGSGKSTTLDAIAGIQSFDKGNIVIDGLGGVGIAPQKNVMWDELTVMEHLRLFNRLKSPGDQATWEELRQSLHDVDLLGKENAKSTTLSGGQKRKLQLAMMLTGGSTLCCIDEVSSGVDPLSRKKLWDILLAERGRRTIVLTTHFLDEADLLSDQIAIMSKGVLRVQGSPVELKANMGAGYMISLAQPFENSQILHIDGVQLQIKAQSATYIAPSSHLAAQVVQLLEDSSVRYNVSSPTIEDVFISFAEEYGRETCQELRAPEAIPCLEETTFNPKDHLLDGRRVGWLEQTGILMRKRLTILKTGWLPYVIAFVIPVVAAAAMQIMTSGMAPPSCNPLSADQISALSGAANVQEQSTIIAGPASVKNTSWYHLAATGDAGTLEIVESLSSLESHLDESRQNISPGGFWLGSASTPPIIIYRANEDSMQSAIAAQNLLNTAHSGTAITARHAVFAVPSIGAGKTLQLAIYFSIALGIAPAFIALYPESEQRTQVRALQYSSGVRVPVQWFSHLAFDCLLMLPSVIAAALIFMYSSDALWRPGFLLPVNILYMIATILGGYAISLWTKSQMATWAAVAAFNGVGTAVYFIAFLFIINFSGATRVVASVRIAHYIIAIIFPGGSLMRAMLLGLNVFSQACDGSEMSSHPESINAYGAPILYLTLQSCLYFGILCLSESRTTLVSRSTRNGCSTEGEGTPCTKNGVKVQALTKKFGDVQALDNVSFNVDHGEVFALLGPNGAGKSTTMSLIRGDLKPTSGDVLIETKSIVENRTEARANIGVCPQMDAIDNMTTEEHLWHYARLRGIDDVSYQVDAVLDAVGLASFRYTTAAHLSGGNKRKLSLGLALTGNPSVILLDEPSSGLDAAAKRVMWQTLKKLIPGRAIILTTHSMEEADTLAQRAGIVSKSLLAIGGVKELQGRLGDSLHVHLVSKTAPHSTYKEMDDLRTWILEMFPDASIEGKFYHGQMRFSVPASSVFRHNPNPSDASSIGVLLVLLEKNKARLGIAYHSITPTTLNEVFLSVVSEARAQQGGNEEVNVEKRGRWRWTCN